MWTVEESGLKSASWNMEADSKRLEDPTPCLRFYEWNAPSATYGYFLNPSDYFKSDCDMDLARRPTGGGVILHVDDLAFSVIVPASHSFYALNSLHSYQMINTLVLQAIQSVIPGQIYLQENLPEAPRGGFCMAKATKYDLLIDGKKVGGAAQRKTKKGLLHQCSLCLEMPNPAILEQLLNPEGISTTSASLGLEHKTNLKHAIIQAFTS